MANTFKVLHRNSATTGTTTLYTTPASTVTMVTSIVVANTSGTQQTYSLSLDDIPLATTVPVPANESIIIEPKQIIIAAGTIKGSASATSVKFHISGLEMT